MTISLPGNVMSSEEAKEEEEEDKKKEKKLIRSTALGLKCDCTRNSPLISPEVMAQMRCCYNPLNQPSQFL